jgi:hypothetical protein
MPLIHMKFITREYVRENPKYLFVFGDTFKRDGSGGQACAMRGEPNAVGIPTKTDSQSHSFLCDSDVDRWRREVYPAIDYVTNEAANGRTIVLPEDGIGTDLAHAAPEIFKELTLLMDTVSAVAETAMTKEE